MKSTPQHREMFRKHLFSLLVGMSSMPAGASTTLEDIVGPRGEWIPIIQSYMVEDPVEKLAFFESGILNTGDPRITAILNAPSPIAAIPYWNPIDANVEPNYSNDVYEDVAVPRAVNTGLQMGRIAYLNEGFSAMSLVKAITQVDPLEYVASVLDNYWMRQAQRRLIASCLGIYNDNAALPEADRDMITNPGTPFTPDAFIDATAQMGDWLDSLGVAAMHRQVYTQMQKANLIEFIVASDAKTRIPFYQGSRVVVDDGMPIFGATGSRQSLVILFAPGAIGYAMKLPDKSEEFEREASRGNGGGVDTLWTRRDMIVHPLGYSFLSTTITGNGTESRPASASWADLALAANWERKLDRKHIPIAFLVVNITG